MSGATPAVRASRVRRHSPASRIGVIVTRHPSALCNHLHIKAELRHSRGSSERPARSPLEMSEDLYNNADGFSHRRPMQCKASSSHAYAQTGIGGHHSETGTVGIYGSRRRDSSIFSEQGSKKAACFVIAALSEHALHSSEDMGCVSSWRKCGCRCGP